MKKHRWHVEEVSVSPDLYNHDYKARCVIKTTVMSPLSSYIIAEEVNSLLTTGNPSSFDINKVIFNDPATIVFWADGTKTVVKCQKGESFDPEKGLAMAISKKALGNEGNYYKTIEKWTDKYYEERHDETLFDFFVRLCKSEVTD